ncbi:DNA polymerase delta small subunit [Entamoeba marina]
MNTQRPTIDINIPSASPFLKEKMEYSHQYSELYNNRLKRLRPFIERRLQTDYPTIPIVPKLGHIPQKTEVAIIGNIFKQSKNIPTLLKEYANSKQVRPLLFDKPTYIDPKDTIIIEDESASINISFPNPASLLSGLTIGLIGILDQQTFTPSAIVSAHCAPQLTTTPTLSTPTESAPHHIALIRDICFQPSKKMLLLFNTLINALSFPSIGRVVIVGQHARPENLVTYDSFLSNIANTVPITLIPSHGDAVNAVAPYQPLHPSLVPCASSTSTVSMCSSPGEVHFGKDNQILKTLFLPIEFIEHFKMFAEVEGGSISVVEKLMEFGHLCPNTPFTFPCFPGETDPFVIDNWVWDVVVTGGDVAECKDVMFGDKVVTIVVVPSLNTNSEFVMFDVAKRTIHSVKMDI